MVEKPVRIVPEIRFGTFEVDLRSGELRKNGVNLKLSGQPFQVLAVLLERPGEVITREEFQKRLWPDTFVDFDHNLNTAINKIREVLGDSAESPRFVETLPRRGYRFIGVVNDADHTASKEKPAFRIGRAFVWVGVSAAVAVIVALVILVWLHVGAWRDRLFERSPRIHALAVLPLENLSNAPEQEYFSDGMTEAIITELGRFSGPRVISRQSIMRFKGSKKALQEIAKELRVDAVVEGTVERSGDRVRISVRLAEIDPERQLWAQEYDRDIHDVLALHADIARSVSNEIRAKLNPDQQRNLTTRQPVDAEAHSEYLKGLYFEHIDTAVAITHFNNSIQRDSTFAPAFAELAMSYFWQAHQYAAGPPVPEMQPLARAAATKALQIDPSLAPAHLALGLLATSDYNWAEAQAQYQASL